MSAPAKRDRGLKAEGAGGGSGGGGGDATAARRDSEGDTPMTSAEEAAEAEHYYEVALSFLEYTQWMQHEVRRRETHVAALPPRHKALLDMTMMGMKEKAFRDAVDANQLFFDTVVRAQRGTSPFPLPATPVREGAAGAAVKRLPARTAGRHFSKAKSTLHQLVREWGAEGAAERASCYGVLLAELQRRLPVTDANRNTMHVACPGSGLGRLPLEVAAKGYIAQGNEFSYQMLMTSHMLLNCMGDSQAIVYPWIHNSNNILRPEHALRPVAIPETSPSAILAGNPDPQLSMCAGEFVEVYGADREKWDAVLSCFFLDTAPNCIVYLELIFAMLKPGGYLINLGPLLYHWADVGAGGATDDRYGKSVELSYSEIKHVMENIGFEFVHESMQPTSYCRNFQCMMATHFSAVHFSARKPVKPKAATTRTGAGAGAGAGESDSLAAAGREGAASARVAGGQAPGPATGAAATGSSGAGSGVDAPAP